MIRNDLTNEQYHADVRSIGKSGLDYVARSPAHYFAAYLDPNRAIQQPTDAMIVGTCYHYAVLEPEKFEKRVVSAPKLNMRTNAGKEAYAEFAAAHPGATIISPDDYDRVRRMRDTLHAHPAARVLVSGGAAELSYYSKCPDTGLKRKARPDFLRRDGVLVDLKSTEDARPDAFARSAWNYRYYVQAPWYLDVIGDAIEQAAWNADSVVPGKDWAKPHLFVFIAQEKSPPYSVMVYEASPQFLDAGRMEAARNMATYAQCVRENYWPTYPEEIMPIELPSWALRNAARLPA